MLDFRFTNNLNSRNINATANLLVQPRLWIPGGDYPGHMEWREKAISELEAEKKRTMLAYWGNRVVGGIIYQRDPADLTRLEIRNISVEDRARGRHIASFLLRQVECEAVIDFPGVASVVADTKRTNAGLIAFALANGYKIQSITRLFGNYNHNGVEDVIFAKNLTP